MPKKGSKRVAKEGSPEPSGSDDGEEYEVERILEHKRTNKGLSYKLKWKNYPVEKVFEPEENVGGAPDVVEAYWSSLSTSKQPERYTPGTKAHKKALAAASAGSPHKKEKKGRKSHSKVEESDDEEEEEDEVKEEGGKKRGRKSAGSGSVSKKVKKEVVVPSDSEEEEEVEEPKKKKTGGKKSRASASSKKVASPSPPPAEVEVEFEGEDEEMIDGEEEGDEQAGYVVEGRHLVDWEEFYGVEPNWEDLIDHVETVEEDAEPNGNGDPNPASPTDSAVTTKDLINSNGTIRSFRMLAIWKTGSAAYLPKKEVGEVNGEEGKKNGENGEVPAPDPVGAVKEREAEKAEAEKLESAAQGEGEKKDATGTETEAEKKDDASASAAAEALELNGNSEPTKNGIDAIDGEKKDANEVADPNPVAAAKE
ncbi:hypothetical protein JCM11641_002579, partial [Rhodosporidiobolus odoratus]